MLCEIKDLLTLPGKLGGCTVTEIPVLISTGTLVMLMEPG